MKRVEIWDSAVNIRAGISLDFRTGQQAFHADLKSVNYPGASLKQH